MRNLYKDNDTLQYFHLLFEQMCRLRRCPRLFGGAKWNLSFEERHFHFGIAETFLEYRTAARYRCSIIARLKFLAVCLRRDCSAPRVYRRTTRARASSAPSYITISVRNLAPERLLSREDYSPWRGRKEDAEWTRTNVAARHAFPVFHSRE